MSIVSRIIKLPSHIYIYLCKSYYVLFFFYFTIILFNNLILFSLFLSSIYISVKPKVLYLEAIAFSFFLTCFKADDFCTQIF